MFLYKRTLNALWLPELDEAEMNEKEELERELPYEELSLMRQATTLELKKELGEKDKISGRDDAIAKRTHWWDKLFRSEDSIKASIESGAEPTSQLTEGQKTKILNKVRGEGTDEEQLEEEDSFSLEDLVKMLTFHVSAEINVGEIGLELWHDKTEKEVVKDDAPGKVASDEDLHGQNIIAVAAREQRKRDDKKEVTDTGDQQVSSKPQRPVLSQVQAPAGLVLTRAQRRRYEGESTGQLNIRPLIRLQINKTTLGLELEPDGDLQLDASIDSVQMLDLTHSKATDPWTSVIHPLQDRVEFGYIGPIVPQNVRTQMNLTHSVVVDQSKPNTVTHMAPSSMPVGIIIRLRRSKDLLNSDQRNARIMEKSKASQDGGEKESAEPRGNKDRSVTDILFGTDPGDDKDSSSLAGAQQAQKQISPAMMFAHSVAVRTSTDLQINNLRISYTDSLVEIPDFIRSPPAPYSDKQKDRMEKGEGLTILDSAQAESDKLQQQTGGEIKRSTDAIAPMVDPSVAQQHKADVQQVKEGAVRGALVPGGENDKEGAKNKEDRLKKEKEAVEGAVQLFPEGQQPSSSQSAAGQAGTTVEKAATKQTVGDTKEDVIVKKPENSLAFLSFFSPMLVRIHAPSPYISLIPDTSALRLQRLTFSLNANARALLDGEADSIHARADVTNVRAWIAPTEPVQAISLAPFHPPTKDSSYIIRPFNIGASFERYPSPLQELMGKQQGGQTGDVRLSEEFNKEVGEQGDLDADDISSVFEGEDAVYHMDADIDISAIHMKLAAKMWYMMQPFINRVKKIMDKNDV